MNYEQIKEALTDTMAQALIDGGTISDGVAAVMALVGPNPLVWDEASDMLCPCLSDSDYTLKYWTVENVWVDRYTTMRRHPTLEAAQAAAQAHANAAHWANTPLADLIGG